MNLLDQAFDILSLLTIAILVSDLYFKKLKYLTKHFTDVRFWTFVMIITGLWAILYFTKFHTSEIPCAFICNMNIILKVIFIGFSVSFLSVTTFHLITKSIMKLNSKNKSN